MTIRTTPRFTTTAGREEVAAAQAKRTEPQSEPMLESLQLLRVADVCRLLRISKPTLWRLRRAHDFPEPMEVTERVIAWRKAEVEGWLRERSQRWTAAPRKPRALALIDARNAVGVSDEPARYKR